MLIVKFGGAAITRKDLECTLRNGTFLRLCHQLADYLKESKEKCILVLGAGSFGYPFARKVQEDPQNAKYYVSKTQFYMTRLISKAAKTLIEDGVPAIPTSSIIFGEEYLNKLIELSEFGFVPITHGTFILNKGKIEVLSGDTIIKELAKKTKVDRIIFVTDVDGIYDKDPKIYPNAKLIPEIRRAEINKIQLEYDDIDKKMYLKIKEISELNCEVGIVNGLNKTAFKDALFKHKYGTRII